MVLIGLLISGISAFSQTPLDASDVDQALLNRFILQEVNLLRKKEKVDTLNIEVLLKPAADDHANYMLSNQKMTHFQKSKEKKTPKNRVDFYGQQFSIVGENVQINNLNNIPKDLKLKPKVDKIESYEVLAKVLVHAWKNSPPHFANMISKDFSTTFTAVAIGPNGEVYACQLFGSDPYVYPDKFDKKVYPYKPDKDRKCKRCERQNFVGGQIIIREDSTIAYVSDRKKPLRKSVLLPWSDGIAADMVLKDQYPCGQESVFNGYRGIRGVPLTPVFRKDFRKGNNVYRRKAVYIELGKVPNWIDQEYEINLTMINRKRTCSSTIFYTIPASIFIDIPIQMHLDTVYQNPIEVKKDTIEFHVIFGKSEASLKDSTIYKMIDDLGVKLNTNTKATIHGFSSIEGSSEGNTLLYEKRAGTIKQALLANGCDSSRIMIKTDENFIAFRRDIKNTPFAYLNNYTNEEIKSRLNNKSLADSLEYILKEHRYATLTLFLTWKDIIELDIQNAPDMMTKAINKKDHESAKEVFTFFTTKVLSDEMTMTEYDSLTIPFEKEYVSLLFQRSLLRTLETPIEDSLDRVLAMVDELSSLNELDPKNGEVNTYMAYLGYLSVIDGDVNQLRDFYKMMGEQKFVNSELRARMMLNVAVQHDLINYLFAQGQPYLYPGMSDWVRQAQLSVDETFGLASFYMFFGSYRKAFDLTKNLIDDTKDPDHLVFFLKLIGIEELGVPHKKYINYFKAIRDLTGDEFCSYFNSPRLNFQILDDEELKAIFCEQCAK